MASNEVQTFEGVIEELLPDDRFRVRLDDGRKVVAYVAGRLRKEYVRILEGDRVAVEMTPAAPDRGRIASRLR
jgi:translation initiation factor IF-1